MGRLHDLRLGRDGVLVTGPGLHEAAPVALDSRLTLTDLVIRDDGGGDAVVGRRDTGEFVALPPIGVRAIALLKEGATLNAAAHRIADEFGEEPDLVDFVEDLIEMGFVATVDGRAVASAGPARRPTLPWLAADHVAWVFSRTAKTVYSMIVLCGLSTVVWRPTVLPSYRSLIFSGSTSAVIVGDATMLLVLVALHELAHLVAARSLGVPGWISLGTRLNNLVAQTDISGLWALPPRQRLRGYLAGMVWDTGLVSTLLLVMATGWPSAAVSRVLAAAVVLLILGLAAQAQLFTRTDLYFVLSDLLGTRNLHEDATVYLLARLRRGGRGRFALRPLRHLPSWEYRRVRRYAWAMLVGSAAALAAFVVLLLPALVELLVNALQEVWVGVVDHRWGLVLDGGVTVAIEGGFQTLFLVVLIRSRRAWLDRLRQRQST